MCLVHGIFQLKIYKNNGFLYIFFILTLIYQNKQKKKHLKH